MRTDKFGVFFFLLSWIMIGGCVSRHASDGASFFYKEDYKSAAPLLIKESENGNPDSQSMLALLYFSGLGGLIPDREKAENLLCRSAVGGDVSALAILDNFYRDDHIKVRCCGDEYLDRTIYNSHEVGVHDFLDKVFRNLLEISKKNASKGKPGAEYTLGKMYENGNGVPQNYTDAAYWYKKSAENGAIESQRRLGFIYCCSSEDMRDFKKSLYWYTEAARSGDAYSQLRIANMYQNGEGGLEKNLKLAVNWCSRSADQGYMDAQYNLGFIYDVGMGVAKDSVKAAYWYKKAADQGSAPAQYLLGYMYEFGNGVNRDIEIAKELYKKSAGQGYGRAQDRLDCLSKTNSCPSEIDMTK